MTSADWAELTGKWFPTVTDTRLRQTTWPQIERHRDYIADMLKAGVTQATIWQRLRDERDLLASLACGPHLAESPNGIQQDQIDDLRATLYGLDAVLTLHFAQEEEAYFTLVSPVPEGRK
jgi:hypothetical protein